MNRALSVLAISEHEVIHFSLNTLCSIGIMSKSTILSTYVRSKASPIMGRLFDKFGPRPLLIPGTIILAAIVFTYRYTVPGVPIWLVIIQLAILMIAVAMIKMPAQTNGLNQIPTRLYPHGTAIMNTLTQVAGAIGATLFISVMENGQQNYLSSNNIVNPTDEELIAALTYGSQQSFSTGFYMALAAIVLALFVRRSRQVHISNE